MALLGFFIQPPYAATGNQTHVGSVSPPQVTLIQDALPTELPRQQQILFILIILTIEDKPNLTNST